MNQQSYITLLSKDLIDKLNFLIRVQGEQSKKLIGQIMYIADTNQHLSDYITNLIYSFFISLKSIDERLNIIYLVDSMMKWIENSPFVETFSKHLFFMFKITFEIADISKKIVLFKLYFLWKYIINDGILNDICNAFGLNEFEEMMNVNEKDVMERYHKIREENRKKLIAYLQSGQSGFNKGTSYSQGSIYSNPYGNRQNIPKTFHSQAGQIGLQIQPQQPQTQQFQFQNHHQNMYFNQNHNQIMYLQPQQNQYNNQTNQIKKEESNDERLVFTPSPKIETENENQNNEKSSILELKEDNTIENLIISSKEDQKITFSTGNNRHQINPQGVIVNQSLLNNKRQANEMGNSQNNKQIQSIFIKNYKNWISEGPKLELSQRLFTSVSLLFKRLNEQTSLLEKLKSSSIIKSETEIISIKSFKDNPLLKFFFDYIFFYLFIDFKYKCSSCGFICKSDEIFWEHKHLHFSNNMLKRTSKRKDIIRKGISDKSSWVTSTSIKSRTGMMSKENSLGNRKYRSTYESVKEFMYRKYVNEDENENINNEESMYNNIYPVKDSTVYDLDEDLKCSLCKNSFELTYISKYSYWFYIDIVKIDGSTYNSLSNTLFFEKENFEEEFLHEKCVIPYIITRLKWKEESSDGNFHENSYDCVSNEGEYDDYHQIFEMKKPDFVFK